MNLEQQRIGQVTTFDFDRLQYMAQRPQYRGVYSDLLRELARKLDCLEVIPADAAPRTLVTMNSRVRVRDEDTGETDVFTLVYPEQADVEAQRISALAPLGRALLGRRAGEVVAIEVPAGRRQLKIDKVLYQPEAQGHFEL